MPVDDNHRMDRICRQIYPANCNEKQTVITEQTRSNRICRKSYICKRISNDYWQFHRSANPYDQGLLKPKMNIVKFRYGL